MALIVDEAHFVSKVIELIDSPNKLNGKKRKRHNAFKTSTLSISLTSFALDIDSTTHPILLISKV